MTKRSEMAGKRFGRWAVVSYDKKGRWHCVCDCGERKSVDGYSIRRGGSKGCDKCRPRKNGRTTHGERRTRLYRIWCGMKTRCLNKNCHAYPRYGGRGIAVCDAWVRSYEEFSRWARNNGYSDNLTIDRKNNEKGYTPFNCRWIPLAEQNRNYSRNRPVQWQGDSWLVGDLAAHVGIRYKTLQQRIVKYGWAVDKAVSEPVKIKTYGKQKPWDAVGMSKSSWYRARKPIKSNIADINE